MSIMTKKEVERLKNRVSHCEYPKISQMQLMELIGTIEEAIEIIKSNRFQLGGHTGWDIAIDEGALKHNTETSLYLIREFLSQYEKED